MSFKMKLKREEGRVEEEEEEETKKDEKKRVERKGEKKEKQVLARCHGNHWVVRTEIDFEVFSISCTWAEMVIDRDHGWMP